MLLTFNDASHPLAGEFRAFIGERAFPCVGAKSAMAKEQMRFVVARDIRSAWDDLRIHAGLSALAEDYARDPKLFQTFVVLFETAVDLTEGEFEHHLWERVQSLSDKDDWLGHEPDERVSHDPDSPHFSLSFAGQAFFVVGLHPNASRPARRFGRPALVFNLHDQFERLRAEGLYEKLRATILARDEALAGSANPMIARHGSISEARQYSGRAVDDDWSCPFSGRAA